MFGMPSIRPLTVVTGHYGTGKTNLAINLALGLARSHGDVTLVDLDVVNPYFRSSDYTALLSRHGVRVVAPTFAGTTLDTPSLPASIGAALTSGGHVLVDAGGDDVGATALGRYAHDIEAADHDVLYVINRYRSLTATPQEAADLLAEIERASRLRATGVVNNSHLKDETTAETVLDSLAFARETARLLGLPLVCTTIPARLADSLSDIPGETTYVENAYPVEVCVRTPWEEAPAVDEEVE